MVNSLGAREAADLIGCSVRTLRRRIENGELKASKQGKGWRIDNAAVDVYQENRRRLHVGKPIKSPAAFEDIATEDTIFIDGTLMPEIGDLVVTFNEGKLGLRRFPTEDIVVAVVTRVTSWLWSSRNNYHI